MSFQQRNNQQSRSDSWAKQGSVLAGDVRPPTRGAGGGESGGTEISSPAILTGRKRLKRGGGGFRRRC